MARRGKRQHYQAPAGLVLNNAVDFLNAGIDILFSPSVSARDAKVGVVAIQTAIELLAKYRLLKDQGLAAIIRGSVPPGDLLAAARSGALRTIGYGECLKAIQKDEAFMPGEEELVGRAQRLRNSLVHFAADIDVDEVRMELAWLLIRALVMFAAGQERDQGEMQNRIHHWKIKSRRLQARIVQCVPKWSRRHDQELEARSGCGPHREEAEGRRERDGPRLSVDREVGFGAATVRRNERARSSAGSAGLALRHVGRGCAARPRG